MKFFHSFHFKLREDRKLTSRCVVFIFAERTSRNWNVPYTSSSNWKSRRGKTERSIKMRIEFYDKVWWKKALIKSSSSFTVEWEAREGVMGEIKAVKGVLCRFRRSRGKRTFLFTIRDSFSSFCPQKQL